jgi:hypothetical protein
MKSKFNRSSSGFEIIEEEIDTQKAKIRNFVVWFGKFFELTLNAARPFNYLRRVKLILVPDPVEKRGGPVEAPIVE